MFSKNLANNGFTLIEIIVVLVILGTILTLGIPLTISILDKQRNDELVRDFVSNLRSLQSEKMTSSPAIDHKMSLASQSIFFFQGTKVTSMPNPFVLEAPMITSVLSVSDELGNFSINSPLPLKSSLDSKIKVTIYKYGKIEY